MARKAPSQPPRSSQAQSIQLFTNCFWGFFFIAYLMNIEVKTTIPILVTACSHLLQSNFCRQESTVVLLWRVTLLGSGTLSRLRCSSLILNARSQSVLYGRRCKFKDVLQKSSKNLSAQTIPLWRTYVLLPMLEKINYMLTFYTSKFYRTFWVWYSYVLQSYYSSLNYTM